MADIELTTAPTETAVDPADLEYFVDVSETPDAINQITTQNRHNSFAVSTTEALTGTAVTKHITPDALASLWEQGSDIASAGTISVGEGGYFFVTGTTTITDVDFATDKAGRKVWLKFNGILTLTHHATTLILPTGANIVTAAGDIACFISEGSDNVRCVSYTRASGAALVGVGGVSVGDSIGSATEGSVFFAGASGVLAQDNANLFFDNTTNRLLVGNGAGGDSVDALRLISTNADYAPALTFYRNTSTVAAQIIPYYQGGLLMYGPSSKVHFGMPGQPADAWPVSISATSYTAATSLLARATDAGAIPIVAKGTTSQTANLFEAQPVGSSSPLVAVGPAGGILMAEMTAPAAPAANNVILYAVDNGSGKTQLMALFSSGAAQQVAIQP